MSKEQCVYKKLHPYYKTGIYGYIGEEVDDNDYIICPICGDVLGMNYWDCSAENDGDNKCPKCKQELDYSEIYDFEDTCYYQQLVEIKTNQISDLEAKLAVADDCADRYWKQLGIVEEENKQLKQQLAEKDEIIIFADKTIKGLILNHNQDKISFALEQLEKVKEYIKTNLMSFQKVPIIQEIDNQIKQLKEMK